MALYQHLTVFLNGIEAYELSLINQGRALTPELLNTYINGTADSFLAFARSNIVENKQLNKIVEETAGKYSSVLSLLETAAGGDVKFSEINEDLLKKLDRYHVANKYEQTTIAKNHTILKQFIKIAIKKGFLDQKNNPYNDYKVEQGESERTNLEPAELSRLENIERKYLNDVLNQVLDRFLYSCYTGLRIGDNSLLSKKHIRKTDDSLVVEMITEKGKGQRIIHHLAHMFDGKPQKIVQKYLDEYPENEHVFPPMADQAINRNLKILASIAEIEKDLTFHVSRHTCGTALADLTANPYLIKDILGHADIKTSMIYIHSSAERVRKQLLLVKWNW